MIYILCLFFTVSIVAECMRLFVSGSESHSIESARYNYSFEEDMYGPMFSSDGYPKPGDIPMLNRKVSDDANLFIYKKNVYYSHINVEPKLLKLETGKMLTRGLANKECFEIHPL